MTTQGSDQDLIDKAQVLSNALLQILLENLWITDYEPYAEASDWNRRILAHAREGHIRPTDFKSHCLRLLTLVNVITTPLAGSQQYPFEIISICMGFLLEQPESSSLARLQPTDWNNYQKWFTFTRKQSESQSLMPEDISNLRLATINLFRHM